MSASEAVAVRLLTKLTSGDSTNALSVKLGGVRWLLGGWIGRKWTWSY
jgi:hypothetical protein